MTTKTPIVAGEIRSGDLIRREDSWGDQASEWRVGTTWSPPRNDNGKYFLLDRPKKLKYPRGTRVYLKDGGVNTFVLGKDHYEGDPWMVSDLHFDYRADFYTDIKPDPHPVGAIRWVTEDTKSPYYYKFKKGDRVKVTSKETFDDQFTVVVRPQTGDDRCGRWIAPNFLSATPVEPEPIIVAVPLPAIEKLRDAERHAKGLASAASRSLARRDAINTFLDTREVKTALRGTEDDLPW